MRSENLVSSLTASYRLSVASRVLAAILGGYMLSALTAFALAAFLPLSRSEASMTATLLSFLIYACAVIWVFTTRTAWRAWAGIIAPSLVLGGLVLIRHYTAGA